MAPLRRGERESEAMDMGDGSAISISIGVPANIVWARPKGVLVLFLRALVGSGESIERSVRSVESGKSPSPLVLTEESGMSFPTKDPDPEKSLTDTWLCVLDRF